MEIIVLHNQSVLDIAIQHTGSVANAFVIAVANGISVDTNIIAGSIFIIPETVKNDNDILNYYQGKQIKPATGITNNQILSQAKRGIGYMKITDGNPESNGFITS